LDEKSNMVVNIIHDHETFIFDKFGKVLQYQLPFTTKAALYKGTEEIKAKWAYKIVNIDTNFPSLINNIDKSISINSDGLITVSENLLMIGTIIIDVCAEYRGTIYTKEFIIKMVQMPDTGLQGVPRYLGKTYQVTNSNIVNIHFTDEEQGDVAAVIGDYISYVGEDEPGASSWKNNYCLQWTGNGWVLLDPLNSAYTDYYMRALRDITDGAGMGVFSTILAKKIMALEVFTDRLEASLIKLRGPNGIIQSDNYDPIEKTGWLIDYQGNAFFNNATIANGLFMEGEIKTGPLQLLNDTPIAQEYTIWEGSNYSTVQGWCTNKPIAGTYGSSQIIRLYKSSSTTESGSYASTHTSRTDYYAFAMLANGGVSLIAHYYSITITKTTYTDLWQNGYFIGVIPHSVSETSFGNPLTLPQTIKFRYLISGKTLKLIDLPSSPPEDMNTVWRNGHFMMIGPV
jgi:hypothetical protein